MHSSRDKVASPRARQFVSATAGTTIGNALGAVLPFVVTFWFKAGASTDAYFYALGTILFLNAFVSLAVESSATPYVVGLKRKGSAAVRRFVLRAIVQGVLAVAFLTVIVSIAVVNFVLPHTSFTADQRASISSMLVILGALPIFVTANAVLAGGHYGYQRFFLPTTSLGLRSLAGLLFGLTLRGNVGLDSIAYGLVAGEAARLILLAASFRRLLRSEDEHEAEIVEADSGFLHTRAFWRTVAPQVVAVGFGGVGLVADKTVAATLEVGGVTIVELTQRMVYMPVLLLASGIGLVLGSAWSELASRHGGRAELRRDFLRTQVRIFLLTAPITAVSIGIVWAGRSLFRTMLGLDDPRLVATAFSMIAIGIPFALASQVAVRLLIASRRTGLFPVLAGVALLVDVGLDIGLARVFGVAGIALASACVNLFNAVAYNIVALRLLSNGKPPTRLVVGKAGA
jgi:putative peptidoglycan lipid II flippase